MANAKEKQLSVQQRLFAHEYSIDGNGTRSARDAGYKGSDETLAVQSSVLLKNPKVSGLISNLVEKRLKKIDDKGDEILRRLDVIGDMDPAEAYTALGAMKNIHDIPVQLRKCIAGIDVLEVKEYNRDTEEMEVVGEIKKLKFWNKIEANKLLGQNKKLFSTIQEHKVTLSYEQLIASANDDAIDVTPQLNGQVPTKQKE